MKSKLINFIVLVLVLITGAYQTTGISQGKKRKAPPQPVNTVRAAEEWGAEPNSTFHKLITALPDIEKVELFYYRGKKRDPFYEDAPPPGADRQFGMLVDVISSKTLISTEAKSFASMWRKLLRGSGAGCLAPAYRVRFYADNKMILESDLCFHCHNLTFKTNENGKGEIWGFNAAGKSGKELLAKLQELLPEK